MSMPKFPGFPGAGGGMPGFPGMQMPSAAQRQAFARAQAAHAARAQSFAQNLSALEAKYGVDPKRWR